MIECGGAVLGSTTFALSLPAMQFQPIFELFDTIILIYLELLFFKTIPSARSCNTGLNSDELAARNLFQECVCVSPSGVAFSI